MSASKSPADVHLDVAPTPKAAAAAPPAPSPARPLWHSLPASSRALLVLGAGSALAAGVFAATQFSRGRLLQDLLLILLTALLSLALLLDAFERENAYQLLACLGLGGLQISQLAVFLAELQGDGEEGAATAVAACLLLLLAAAAVARSAYLGWGWRMYSKFASAWRLRPAEQQRLRAAALARQRFSAVAKLDASLLVLLLVVAAVNAANPSASASSAQPVGLLIGAAAAAAPLLASWLAACWLAVRARRPSRLAGAVDLAFPLCYVPPLLILFAGATKGTQLHEPHGQAYLIAYSVLFLMARTATWWAARQLACAYLPLGAVPTQQQQLQQVVAASGPGSADSSTDEHPESHLPAELLPLVRGAWLLKLPSGGGSSSSGGEEDAAGSGDALQPGISTTSSLGLTSSGSVGVPCSTLCCLGSSGGGGWSWLRWRGSRRGRQRFFQLSTDGACLRWNWHRWVLMPHVEAVHCNDEEQTIRLVLLLERDLNLRFACPRQYSEWQLGLRLLLELLQQPEDLLLSSCRSSPTAAAAAAVAAATGSGLLGRYRSSGANLSSGDLRPGSSGGNSSSGGMGRFSSSLCSEAILHVPAAAGGSAAAAAGEAEALHLPVPRLPSINTGRVCSRADSARQLQLASAHSRALLVAAAQRQEEPKQPDQGLASKPAADLPQEQRQPGDGGSADGSGGDGSSTARSEGGAAHTRRNTIHLVASAQSVRGLHIRTSSSSEAPQDKQPRQQPAAVAPAAVKLASPRGGSGGGKAGRLRSGLRRAVTFPASLLDRLDGKAAGGPGAAGAAAVAPAAVAAALAGKEQALAIEPRHERTFTLMDWAEGQPAGEAGGQGIAAVITPGAVSADGSPQPTPSPLPSSRLRQRTPPSAGAGGRMLPGPFIHLVAFAGPSRQHSLQAGTTAAPSPDGSEASTPQQRSPLRGGSPERQHQLHNFQQYLQQQLAAQQRGRYGPLLAGEGGGSGSYSGAASGNASPYSSPCRRGSPGGTPSPPRRREGTPSPTNGPLPQAHHTPSPSRLSRVAAQQQQFTARLQSAGSGAADAAAAQHAQQAAQQAAQQGQQGQHGVHKAGPRWDEASTDAGSDLPPSASLASLAGHSLGGSGQLAHAESAGFSSWGLPSPSTATARTPFNGLSRFNSLAGSAQYSPQAGHRPALPFAPAGQQQQAQWQQAGGGASHAPWAGILPFAGSHPAGGAAGGSGSDPSSARGEGDEAWQAGAASDAPMGPELISPMAMGILGGLGISVPVEMIDYRDLEFGKFLGEGSEGSVYAAWHHETPVAVKRTRSLMEIEMNLHAGVHDNIVGLRGLCSHGGELYLVMELCPRGTLDVLVHRSAGSGHRLEPAKLLPIVRSIARGMVHLHSRRPAIFHRDLKPGNVFLGHGGVVKVGDLGMSRYAAQCRGQGEAGGGLERTLTPGVIGTAAYAAPELLNPETPGSAAAGRQVTPAEEARILKADVYSFGVTLFEIMERRRPFAGMDGFQIQTQWYMEPQSMRLPRPAVPEGLAPQARAVMETLADLVEKCTQWEPDKRPTFQDVLAALRAATEPADPGKPPAVAQQLVNPI